MSLRRKDDWDEALEASARRTPAAFIAPADYDYGTCYSFTLKDLEATAQGAPATPSIAEHKGS